MAHKFRTAHRASALFVAVFLVAHIGNHLIGVAGPSAHIGVMHALRLIYRNGIIEPLLLVILMWQATSGMILVIRGWKARSGAVAWIQAISGLYLFSFLFIHVAAVLGARAAGIDTNIYFAAAGFHVPAWPWFFAPYYILAVWSLFTHAGTAIYWNMARDGKRKLVLACIMGVGLIAAMMIATSMAVLHMPATGKHTLL